MWDRGNGVVFFLGRIRWEPVAVVVALGVCLALPCPAQMQADANTVQGVVLNSLNREPIARALVEAGGNAVLTDTTGHFELALPSDSNLPVAARKPGYASGQNSTRMILGNANTADLTLLLTPQAVIAGHISVATGEDADNTRIMLFRQRAKRGQSWWETRGLASTDSAGHFRLSNLETPAEYLLMTVPATDREGRVHANSSTSGYPSVFYPDGGETSTAGLLSLSPGQQANVELSLTRQPFYPVTIQVKNDVGATPLLVQVHDETGLQSDFQTQWNVQKRTAQVDLPNGKYFAELRSYNQPELFGRADFTVAGGPVTGVTAVLLPLRPVQVNIRKVFTVVQDIPASSAVGSSRTSNQADPGINLQLVAVEGASGQVGALAPVPGATDPMLFQLTGVSPGRYWVAPTAYEGYIASITSGGVDLSREALTIGPGNTTPPIEVTLRNDGGSIHCTIQHSAGGTGNGGFTSVFAVPIGQTMGQTMSLSNVNGGETVIPNVAPGTYTVIALDEFVDIDGLEPAVLNFYLTKGQAVTVEAQGSVNAMLDVVHVSDTGEAAH